jgi:hypothetical protein
VYAPNKQENELEGERKRKKSVEVSVVTGVVHEIGSSCGNSEACVFVLKTLAARVEENLLG